MSLAYDRPKTRSHLAPLLAHLEKNLDLSRFQKTFTPADVTDLCELAYFLHAERPAACGAVLVLAQDVVRAAGLAAEVFVPAIVISAPKKLSSPGLKQPPAGFSLRKGARS